MLALDTKPELPVMYSGPTRDQLPDPILTDNKKRYSLREPLTIRQKAESED
jgi:hypothetical protein